MGGLLLSQIFQQFDGQLRAHFGVDLVVDGDHGGKPAGAQAGHRLQGEQAVGGGLLLLLQLQVFPDGIVDGLRLTHVTGGAVTHFNNVLALGLQGEVFVEGGHAVYLCHADIQLLGDQLQNLGAEILKLRLHVLHDGDQMVALAAVGVDNLLHTGQ